RLGPDAALSPRDPAREEPEVAADGVPAEQAVTPEDRGAGRIRRLHDRRSVRRRLRARLRRAVPESSAYRNRQLMALHLVTLALVPSARVGYIGLQRDEETAVASQYYTKLPRALTNSDVLMIDPMLATGGSASAALELPRHSGARRVRIVCIVSAPEGVAVVEKEHPDVSIYTPAVDSHLNAHKYIVPGLGDFGDRLYGTL